MPAIINISKPNRKSAPSLKTALCMLLAVCLLIGSLSGCGIFGEKLEPTDTLVVCYEQSYRGQYEPAFEAFRKRNPDVTLETVGLPGLSFDRNGQIPEEQRMAREAAITSLRIEVMAGKGPDLFVMLDNLTGGVPDGQEKFIVGTRLFNDVDKVMRAGVFCDLAPLMELAGLAPEHYVEPVLAAGQVDGVQYTLPLGYGMHGFLFAESFLAEHNLTEEALRMPFTELLPQLLALDPDAWPTIDDFCYQLLEQRLDYDAGKTTFNRGMIGALMEYFRAKEEYERLQPNLTEQEWRKYIAARADSFIFQSVSNRLVEYLQHFEREGKTDVFVPMYDNAGGVQVNIFSYAGVRANSENKYNAAKMLEILNETRPSSEGESESFHDGVSWRFSSHKGGLKNYVNKEYNSNNGKFALPESLLNAEALITGARFISTEQVDIFDEVLDKYKADELTLDEALDEMERMLKRFIES